MTRALRLALALMLGAPLTCSMACTRTVRVPELVPSVSCPLDPFPPFPDVRATQYGDQVCLTPEATSEIWMWVRDAQRWAELATTCLDANS